MPPSTRPLLLAVLVAVLLGAGSSAHAETHRIAIVVGNNRGGASLPPLRYAEDDADKIGRVLTELGGVPPSDLFLIKGGSRRAVEAALATASQRIAAWRRAPGGRVVLLFYFSGHSDGLALELGRERLGFSELRRWLGTTGAEVRLALVDTCKSGALLAAKGGAPGAGFRIRFSEEIASSGEALLTSSAADEIALESREIGGSYFTHHLVSGLRGAADASGDGRVTLTEAYQYAYAHTITTTGATLSGPQHPVYDYRLTGRGELVLTELSRRTAALALPDGIERALVIDARRRQAIAELGPDAPRRVAVTAGRYVVRAWLAGKAYEGTFEATAEQTVAVRWTDLALTTAPLTIAKGGTVESSAWIFRGGRRWELTAGVQAGVAGELGALPSLRLAVASEDDRGFVLGLQAGSGRGGTFRETSLLATAGYRWGGRVGNDRVWLEVAGGGGVIDQERDTGRNDATGAAVAMPAIGFAKRLGAGVDVVVSASWAAALIRRDGAWAIASLPTAHAGLATSF